MGTRTAWCTATQRPPEHTTGGEAGQGHHTGSPLLLVQAAHDPGGRGHWETSKPQAETGPSPDITPGGQPGNSILERAPKAQLQVSGLWQSLSPVRRTTRQYTGILRFHGKRGQHQLVCESESYHPVNKLLT